MNKLLPIAIAAGLGAGPFIATPVAATTLSGLEGSRTVPDSELATMRGKFVAASHVSYFGVQMASSWQGGDGVTTSALLLFNVDFAKGAGSIEGATPRLLVSWSRDCGSCGDTTMDVRDFGAAAQGGYVALGATASLGDVHGAVQGQQIAGSDNLARNDLRIQIVPAASITTDVSGMTEVTAQGEQVHDLGGGESVRFTVSGNSLGIGLTDQNGATRQTLDGNLGQISQHLMIGGDGNLVRNGMAITIGIDQAGGSRQLSVTGAMEAMKTRGF